MPFYKYTCRNSLLLLKKYFITLLKYFMTPVGIAYYIVLAVSPLPPAMSSCLPIGPNPPALCLIGCGRPRPPRCVPAAAVGAVILLEEPHRAGLHAGPLLRPGGRRERRLRQPRRRRQPGHGRRRHRDVPAACRQREEAAPHSLPLCTGSKDLALSGLLWVCSQSWTVV